MYLESRTKKIFAIACLEKKLVFHTKSCEYFEYLISKIGLFHRVKELFKSNQTGYGVYHGQVESKTKRILAIACLAKKFYYYSKVRASGPLEVHPPAPLRRRLVGSPPRWDFVHLICGDVSFFSNSTVTSVIRV